MVTGTQELRRHARPLVAATLGMGFGLQLALYAAGLFGPALIAEFGWTKSQYALPGVLAFVTVFVFPLAGRLTDRLGVRRVAAMGIAGVAAVTVGMGLMTGPYWQFLALSLGKTVFGTMATTAVFTRLVAERFDAARGVALAVVISGPPLIAAGAIPLLDGIIADQGWRTAYFVLGGMILAGGGLALLLAPRTGVNHFRGAARPDSFRADFRRIARRRVFWVLLAAMFLVNMPQVLGGAQLKLMAMDSGATSTIAVAMMSTYAIGVVCGRLACGLALDRLPAHLVAFGSLMLPAAGFLALYSPFDPAWILIGGMAMIGLAQGSEGDIAAYMVARHFDIANYSFVLSMVSSALTAGAATGSLVLTAMLHVTDDFTPFVLLAAIVSFLGASTFLLIGRPSRTEAT